jgi:hypothetical protein
LKIKLFDSYLDYYSKDPSNFEKKIRLVGECAIPELFDSSEESDSPIIIWSNGHPELNEGLNFFKFNKGVTPNQINILKDFKDSDYVPNQCDNRVDAKNLAFPIIAQNGEDSIEFKTYNKLKKSEKDFTIFSEKPKKEKEFEILIFKNSPIHIDESIKGSRFDANKNFKYNLQVNELSNTIHEKYGFDFYKIKLLESNKKVYLTGISTSDSLEPIHLAKIYETAYENFYETRLPQWFKKHIFENYVKESLKSKYYDALLLNKKYAEQYKKYC